MLSVSLRNKSVPQEKKQQQQQQQQQQQHSAQTGSSTAPLMSKQCRQANLESDVSRSRRPINNNVLIYDKQYTISSNPFDDDYDKDSSSMSSSSSSSTLSALASIPATDQVQQSVDLTETQAVSSESKTKQRMVKFLELFRKRKNNHTRSHHLTSISSTGLPMPMKIMLTRDKRRTSRTEMKTKTKTTTTTVLRKVPNRNRNQLKNKYSSISTGNKDDETQQILVPINKDSKKYTRIQQRRWAVMDIEFTTNNSNSSCNSIVEAKNKNDNADADDTDNISNSGYDPTRKPLYSMTIDNPFVSISNNHSHNHKTTCPTNELNADEGNNTNNQNQSKNHTVQHEVEQVPMVQSTLPNSEQAHQVKIDTNTNTNITSNKLSADDTSSSSSSACSLNKNLAKPESIVPITEDDNNESKEVKQHMALIDTSNEVSSGDDDDIVDRHDDEEDDESSSSSCSSSASSASSSRSSNMPYLSPIDIDDGVSSVSFDSLRRHNPYWTPEHQDYMVTPPLIISFTSKGDTMEPTMGTDQADDCSWLSPIRLNLNVNCEQKISTDKNNNNNTSTFPDVLPEWQTSWLNQSRSLDSLNNENNVAGSVDEDDPFSPTTQKHVDSTRWKWSNAFTNHSPAKSCTAVSQLSSSPKSKGIDAALRPLKLRFHSSAPYIPMLDHSCTTSVHEQFSSDIEEWKTINVSKATTTSKTNPLFQIQNTDSTNRQRRYRTTLQSSQIRESKQQSQDHWITSPVLKQQKFRLLSRKRSMPNRNGIEQQDQLKRPSLLNLHEGRITSTQGFVSYQRPNIIAQEQRMTSTGAVVMRTPTTSQIKLGLTRDRDNVQVENKNKSTLRKDLVLPVYNDVVADVGVPTVPSRNISPQQQQRKDRSFLPQHRRTISTSDVMDTKQEQRLTAPSLRSSADVVGRYHYVFKRAQSEGTLTTAPVKPSTITPLELKYPTLRQKCLAQVSESKRVVSHRLDESNQLGTPGDNRGVTKRSAIHPLQNHRNNGYSTSSTVGQRYRTQSEHCRTTSTPYQMSQQLKQEIQVPEGDVRDDSCNGVPSDGSTRFWHNGRLQTLASPRRYNTLYCMKNVTKKINKERLDVSCLI